MKQKGFFLLINIITILLGSSMLLSILLNYREGLIILQKKLLLEEAIQTAEASLYGQPFSTRLHIEEAEKILTANITIRETKVVADGKTIYSILIAK